MQPAKWIDRFLNSLRVYTEPGMPSALLIDQDDEDELRGYIEGLWCQIPQWQPIETAPKDGKEILIHWGNKLMDNGYWNGMYWSIDENQDYYIDASHWMPLPQPPKGDE